MRKPGQRYLHDELHLVRVSDVVWNGLRAEAWPRRMSRARLARIILAFVLDNPEIVQLLLDGEKETNMEIAAE